MVLLLLKADVYKRQPIHIVYKLLSVVKEIKLYSLIIALAFFTRKNEEDMRYTRPQRFRISSLLLCRSKTVD